MAATVIDSFLIALGFRVDPSGAAQMKKQTEGAKANLLSLGNAVKAFAASYVVKSVVQVSDVFEQNTIAISGFLEALDISKAGDGMKDAADTIRSIEIAAAKLPGEAEEYVEVFRAGLPMIQAAMPGGSLTAITDFTNRFAAIGKTLRVDAPQIGRDLSLMLGVQGRAGSHVLTFQRMLPFIRQIKGQAALTAESFNAMTQPQRLALLQEALANPALSSMLDRSANSFDAMFGAAKSMVKTLVRLSTAGLFKGAKDGLDAIRSVFMDDSGKLTSTGQAFVDIMQKVGYGVARMVRLGASAVKMLLKFVDSSIEVKLGLVGIAGALIGVQKLLKFGLIGAILLVVEDLKTFYEGGRSITGLLMEQWPTAIYFVQGLLAALGGAFIVLQGKAVGAALKAGYAWAAANAPLILMLAGIGALIISITTLISKWEEFKATAKFWKNMGTARFKDAMEGIFGGDQLNVMHAKNQYGKELEDIAFRKSGRLTPGAEGPAFKAGSGMSTDPTYYGPGGAEVKPGATAEEIFNAKWANAYAAGNIQKVGSAAGPVTNNTTINVNGARDPRAVADEVNKIQQRQSRNTVRANQKAHAY